MEKLKACILDSPQIRELMKDPMFDEALIKTELLARQLLKLVITNFQGNHQSVEYGTQMSGKLHLLWSHRLFSKEQ